jgi:antitoxin component YwqK of YwqJK toxin-antitoxin module
MKTLFSLLIGTLHFVSIGQEKNCNGINGAINYCNVEILYEKNDSIYCIINEKCDQAKFDLTKNSTWIVHFKDTTSLFEIASFINGKQTKGFTEYYKNGNLKIQCNYENGELVGPYLSLNEDGTIKWSGLFENGIFVGAQYKYWDNGHVAEISTITETSQYGLLISYFDPSGKQLSEKEFKKLWNCD